MGKVTGFMEFERVEETYEAPVKRIHHYKEFVAALSDADAKVQSARCMDCGIPFCNIVKMAYCYQEFPLIGCIRF